MARTRRLPAIPVRAMRCWTISCFCGPAKRRIAAGRQPRGRVDEGWIGHVLADAFFARPPPKSLDRNAFRPDVSAFSLHDGAATLTALTAAAVVRAADLLPQKPRSWIVAGGGARNATLMRMLAERLVPATVDPAAAVGW